MSVFLMIALLQGTAVNRASTCTTIGSPLSPGEGFIPLNGIKETVKRVAVIEYGPDTVGFVYQSLDGRLFAQARSGMPGRDQHRLGIAKILPPHKTGEKYLYSSIIPMGKNPWADLIIRFC